MQELSSNTQLEEDFCIQIFTVSAVMIGVCLTAIGIIRVLVSMSNINTLVDDLLAVDTALFLFACLFSYWALRMRGGRRMYRLERVADVCFIGGLALMASICAIMVYAISMFRSVESP